MLIKKKTRVGPDVEKGNPDAITRHGFYPWVRKIPWGRKWQPTQYSCLGNPMDRGALRATVHGVAKSWTQLSRRTHLNC